MKICVDDGGDVLLEVVKLCLDAVGLTTIETIAIDATRFVIKSVVFSSNLYVYC
jgi:hypothetical protein